MASPSDSGFFAAPPDPAQVNRALARAWRDFTTLSMATAARMIGAEGPPAAQPGKGDRRFGDAAWSDEPVFDYLKQAYLLAEGQVGDLVAGADLDERTRTQA